MSYKDGRGLSVQVNERDFAGDMVCRPANHGGGPGIAMRPEEAVMLERLKEIVRQAEYAAQRMNDLMQEAEKDAEAIKKASEGVQKQQTAVKRRSQSAPKEGKEH